ncbi:MAG TPA: ubiquinone biosynthesis protein UbiA, partial [Dehalococcoidia bacterium]|nr:ubiquinone biosynthesis protein UbiA [Dehalococcoidia bacterium]
VYDFWLKRTPASGLPYAVALPLLPIWVWVALGQFQPVLLALVPLAGCIGLALHLANGLTDFDSDVLVGSGGLVQRLGKRSALFLCWGSFGLALVLVVASAMAIPYQESLLAAGLCAATLALASAIVLYLCRPVQRSLQIGWAILVSATAILALTWIASLPR